MKILAAGNFSSEYVKDSWQKPMQEIFSALCVNVVPLMAEGDSRYQLVQRYIQSLIRSEKFDFFYFYTDGLQLVFPDSFFNSIRSINLPIVVFHADDEPEIWYQLNKRFDHRYDVVASHSKRGWQRRRDEGFGKHSLYIPWGFNPNAFYKIPGLYGEYQYDVVFIGKHKRAGITAIKDEDGKLRQDILVKVYNICQKNGYSFRVFGTGWENHPLLKDADGGLLTHDEMIKVYNQSRIVFNPGYSSDEDFSGYQTKLRHYEVPGCGAFQMVNFNPELADQFKPNREIVFYQDESDLEDKLLYYLGNDKQREEIALGGYQRAHQEHTTVKRLNLLFQKTQSLFPKYHYQKAKNSDCSIAQIYITNIPNSTEKHIENNNRKSPFIVPNLNAALDLVKNIKGDFDYLHLLPGNNECLEIELDYRYVITHLHSPPISEMDGISFNSVIQLMQKHSNHVQVNWHNFSGFTLKPGKEEQKFQKSMKKLVFPFVESAVLNKSNLYLFNYFIKPESLIKLWEKMVKGDISQDFKLNVHHINRNVIQITIKHPFPKQYSYRRYHYQILFEYLVQNQHKVLVYGAQGNLVNMIIQLLDQYPAQFIGFIDRTLAGQKIYGYQVYGKENLKELNPTAILISAETSGAEIYQSLSHWQCRAEIYPLYDFSDEIWNLNIF